ncbi:hypothetical protein FG386_001080 [Cryptosporidium ryanae]|uniref:uncharacterized protein n=1 Tax=Cryptosporidium ryanae TaxID=515981 RepID=UPI00351A5D18|nr:hypothetical protein FG386_001080 [Cryptosporidium ryanae]
MNELTLNLELNLKKDDIMLNKDIYFLNRNNLIENHIIRLSTEIRPSVLHSICSAFPVCKRTLIEIVINELFHEFVTKPDGMVEDAKYSLCIPTLYSVLLLTVCHVHKLKDHEEEWFEEFLKNKKFSFLTPSGCKTEALFNLLNVLACFGSLKKRPANMQGVELVLLRLGISFYFSLCYIMDYPFSTNRIIKALISGAHEWIHGSKYTKNNVNNSNSDYGYNINHFHNYKYFNCNINNNFDGYNNNKNITLAKMSSMSNSNKFVMRKISFNNKKEKMLIQENTIKNLIGVFDDFTIKLICKYGYRPHCINWNEVTLYINEMNDLTLLNLFKFTKNNNFFDDNFLNEFIYSFNNINDNEVEELSNSIKTSNEHLLNNRHANLSSGLSNYINSNDYNYNIDEFKKIIDEGVYKDSNCQYSSIYNKQNYGSDRFSLSEFQDSDEQSDDYDNYYIDNALNQEFIEKLHLSSHTKNNALTAISSKIKEMASSKSAKLFNLNKLTKKQLNRTQLKNCTNNVTKGSSYNDMSKNKSIMETANTRTNTIYKTNNSINKDSYLKNIVKKPLWFGFSKQFSDQSNTKQNNSGNSTPKKEGISNLLNYISHKQQIYESEDNEDPLNVL